MKHKPDKERACWHFHRWYADRMVGVEMGWLSMSGRQYPRLSSATPVPQKTVSGHTFSSRGRSVQSAALFVGEGYIHHS